MTIEDLLVAQDDESRYVWSPYFALGYDKEYLDKKVSGWAEGILELITDEVLVHHCCDNLGLILNDFSHDTAFLLLLCYSDAFILSPETFSKRLNQVKKKLGPGWNRILYEQFWEDEASIFDAMGYLREQTWLEALDRL